MKVEVSQDLCVSCGSCVDLCPEVFQWGDNEKAVAMLENIPLEIENEVGEAVENCPTNAILEM